MSDIHAMDMAAGLADKLNACQHRDYCRSLEAQLTAKTEECERLRGDRERLEFLVDTEGFVFRALNTRKWMLAMHPDPQRKYSRHGYDNWRDAIDEAMSHE